MTKTCANCGGTVAEDSLWVLCTRCLFAQANDATVAEGADPGIPRQFGDYVLGERLGRGGMGVVYRATQIPLRRDVALKLIIDWQAASPTQLRRFQREAEAAAKLDHPNIVPIYEVGEYDGQPFLSMKLIAGHTLKQKISRGEFCLFSGQRSDSKSDLRRRATEIVELMSTIARAVHHAHQQGVLHRDLKPGNILLDADNQPHLTDFGLAKMLGEAGDLENGALTVSGSVLGTPCYMSPEQAKGETQSIASDVYSLGAILYEMLVGVPPFRADSPVETLRLVIDQDAKPAAHAQAGVDKELDTICQKCLAKDAAARYPSAAALAEDLDRWRRHEPIHARPAGLGFRARRWVSRNRLAAALIVSVCCGLAAAVVLREQANARQKKLDLHRANNLLRLSRDIEQLWNDPDQPFLAIPSTTLAELANLPPRAADAATSRLTVGLIINHEPFGPAMQYAPFLRALEDRLERQLHRPVIIDLRLYKSEADSIRDAERGKLDLQRIGSYLYLLARQTVPGLEAIARENSQKSAVIFASKASGITNLAQVAGKRVAFGLTNSAVSFWAKVHLARAGITAAQLQTHFHVSPARDSGENGADQESDAQAQKWVIAEVLAGRADVGEARRRFFELARYRRGGLVELLEYPVWGHVYVARPGLDRELQQAFRNALTSFENRKDKAVLAKLSHNIVIEGFQAVADEHFNDLRQAYSHELATFEGRAR